MTNPYALALAAVVVGGLVVSLTDNYVQYTSVQWYVWALATPLAFAVIALKAVRHDSGRHGRSRPGHPYRVAVIGDYPENPPNLVGGIQAVMYYTLAALKQETDLELHVITCEKSFQGETTRRSRA